jgi:translation initiation factor 1
MGVCSVCGLPKEICACEAIAKEAQRVKIKLETRTYSKVVTVVDGINPSEIDINDLAKKLRTHCASGGTVKNGRIELQGNHKHKVEKVLRELGFFVE